YDSLHYVADREFDLVFIDEFEQNMAHLSGGTMDGTQARRAYDTLCAVLRSAGQVVVADAHLTDNLKKWLVSLRGAEGMLSIENTYRHDWDALTLYSDKASLISQALKHAQRADKPVVITANSRAETELLRALFADELGENNVFVINGWNSSHKTRRFFLQAIDAQIATKQVVICSPTIGTGIDIQAKVAGVYGIFGRDTWGSATTIMQQMMRFRNADERHLYVQPVFAGAEETDPQARYQRHIDRTRGTASLAHFGDFNTSAIDTTDRAILMVESIQKASRAIQRNDLFSYTVAYAKDEGFTIAYDENSDYRMGERLSELRSELQEDARDKTLNLDPIDHEQFDDLLQRGEVKRESYYGNLRWKIEQTAGQAINEELYGLLRTARLRADFNRFVDMQGNLGDLQQRDRDQAHYQHLLSQRGHYTRNVQLITGALQAVFGVDWHLSKATFTAEDIAEKLVPYLTACLRDIQVYIDHRTDLSIDPVALLRRLLKRVALKLTSKQQRVDAQVGAMVDVYLNIAQACRQIRYELFCDVLSRKCRFAQMPIHTKYGLQCPCDELHIARVVSALTE
ncbi:MAG: plasmid replication protein, CyRepA1 family, partial [Chloroflexota bacterium]